MLSFSRLGYALSIVLLVAALLTSVICSTTTPKIEYEVVCNQTIAAVTNDDCDSCHAINGCEGEILKAGCWKSQDNWYSSCMVKPCILASWELQNDGTHKSPDCQLRCPEFYKTCTVQIKTEPPSTAQRIAESTTGSSPSLSNVAWALILITSVIVIGIVVFLICYCLPQLKERFGEKKEPYSNFRHENPSGPSDEVESHIVNASERETFERGRAGEGGNPSPANGHSRSNNSLVVDRAEDRTEIHHASDSDDSEVSIASGERVRLIKSKNKAPVRFQVRQEQPFHQSQPGPSTRPDPPDPSPQPEQPGTSEPATQTPTNYQSTTSRAPEPQPFEELGESAGRSGPLPALLEDADSEPDPSDVVSEDDHKPGTSAALSPNVDRGVGEVTGRAKPSDDINADEEERHQKNVDVLAEHLVEDTDSSIAVGSTSDSGDGRSGDAGSGDAGSGNGGSGDSRSGDGGSGDGGSGAGGSGAGGSGDGGSVNQAAGLNGPAVIPAIRAQAAGQDVAHKQGENQRNGDSEETSNGHTRIQSQ